MICSIPIGRRCVLIKVNFLVHALLVVIYLASTIFAIVFSTVPLLQSPTFS